MLPLLLRNHMVPVLQPLHRLPEVFGLLVIREKRRKNCSEPLMLPLKSPKNIWEKIDPLLLLPREICWPWMTDPHPRALIPCPLPVPHLPTIPTHSRRRLMHSSHPHPSTHSSLLRRSTRRDLLLLLPGSMRSQRLLPPTRPPMPVPHPFQLCRLPVRTELHRRKLQPPMVPLHLRNSNRRHLHRPTELHLRNSRMHRLLRRTFHQQTLSLWRGRMIPLRPSHPRTMILPTKSCRPTVPQRQRRPSEDNSRLTRHPPKTVVVQRPRRKT